MKVLFYGISGYSDTLCNVLMHGFRSLLGENLVDIPHLSYMYNTRRIEHMGSHHGNGFTFLGRLDELPIDRLDIDAKIKNHYFDLIVFGSIHRFDDAQFAYLSYAQQYYRPNEIVLIDGSDYVPGNVSPQWLNAPGIHFTRENRDEKFKPDAYPLSVAIPRENIVDEVPTKTVPLMSIIPGLTSTYKYNLFQEKEYYKEYQESYFALTWKRPGGWEAVRHYEILSQGCMPLFLDIHWLPEGVMTTFPRKQVEHLLDVAVKIEDYKKDMKFNYVTTPDGDKSKVCMIDNVKFDTIQFNDPADYGYYDIANELLAYTKTYLTTEYQAKYILDVVRRLQ